jgi:hypothetical protein
LKHSIRGTMWTAHTRSRTRNFMREDTGESSSMWTIPWFPTGHRRTSGRSSSLSGSAPSAFPPASFPIIRSRVYHLLRTRWEVPIFKGGKPSRKGYERAMERMKTDRDTTFFVGDQLFTDVWGANRTGLYSILVKPINPKEEIQIVLKRYLEAVVLMFYRKRLKKTGRTAGDFCKK